MKAKVNRRKFLEWAAMGAAGSLAAACQPKTVIVKETVVVKEQVEKVITQVVEVEREVTKIVAGTPVIEKIVETKVVEKIITPTPMPGWEGTVDVYLGGTFQPDVARGEGLEPLHEARALADEWEEMHPGVMINYIEGPGGEDMAQWVKSRQAAGSMPDICSAVDNWLNRDIGTGYWIPIDAWINTPNPYIPAGEPGHERFRDAFIAGFDARNLMIDRRYYGFSQGITGVQIYCNLDILEKAGIDFEKEIINPRWTFDSMLDLSAKVQDAGITPWALAWNSPYWNWIQTSTLCGWLKSTGRWDVMDTNNDDFVTSRERFEAILSGDWAADTPEMRAMLKLGKDWSAYWAEGYLGLTSQDVVALFARGETAFMWNGSWYYPTILGDEERDFDFAVARFPLCMDRFKTIGKGGPTQYPGGAYSTLGLSSTAAQKGSVESCIDFLKYFLSCDGQTRTCTEHGGIVPVIKCAAGNPDLEQFKPAPDETFLLTIHMNSMNTDYAAAFWRITSEWMGGTKSLDDALKQFQVEMEFYAKDAVERAEES